MSAALVPLRRYAEAQLVTARAKGEPLAVADWSDVLAMIERAETELATGEYAIVGDRHGLYGSVGPEEPEEPEGLDDLQEPEPDVVGEARRIVGRGWGMVRRLVRRGG